MNADVLVVDDEAANRDLFVRLLAPRYSARAAAGGEEALRILARGAPGVLVTDLRMPGMDGLELARQVRELYPSTEIALVTGKADLESAIRAIRVGVVEFLQKPVDRDMLRLAVAKCLERRNLLRSYERLQRESSTGAGLGALVGESAPMARVRAAIARVQNNDATVLILGETGTGKELVARALHDGGHRAGGAFVAVNCAAVAPELLEAELFGHEAGAFTGAQGRRAGLLEAADGGTFFLDEVGELPLELQAKLLRVLQERRVLRLGSTTPVPIDLRLVAATNRDLATEVAAGRFRRDLFFRLNVYPVRTPALRDRLEDVPILLDTLRARLAAAMGAPDPGADPALAAALGSRHAWPGNVRELENLIHRMMLLAEGAPLAPEHFEAALAMEEEPGAGPPPPGPGTGITPAAIPADASGTPPLPLAEVERRHIQRALEFTEGNLAAASRILGIHPTTLKRKLRV